MMELVNLAREAKVGLLVCTNYKIFIRFLCSGQSVTCNILLQHVQQFVKQLKLFHQTKLFADVQIICEDGQVESHSVFLAAGNIIFIIRNCC